MRIHLTLILLFSIQLLLAQVSGNINYQQNVRLQDNQINVSLHGSDLVISVKGLSNIRADAYVAIFSVTQTGLTTDEANELMDQRIDAVVKAVAGKPGVETYVDMVSFVPMYEYSVEKKIFSKKTYNEVPAGFELKKNIHIQYKDPAFIHELVDLCGTVEIYDLVRVDYVSENMRQQKKELRDLAKTVLEEKLKFYQGLVDIPLDSLQKNMADGYRVLYPVEMYRAYQAYNSSSIRPKRSAKVREAEKSTTSFYYPIQDKEFDFVINPVIVEPVIQLMYELKIQLLRPPKTNNSPTKEYYLIAPSGEMKRLELRE